MERPKIPEANGNGDQKLLTSYTHQVSKSDMLLEGEKS